MQMGIQTDLILLDFSKAVNTVVHEKLLLKLHHYGISGDTLKWIKEFWIIENRQLLLMELTRITSQSPLASRMAQFLAQFSSLHT